MKQFLINRELSIRLLYFIVSVMITAVGAAVFLLSGTGTDPFGMLMQGVAKLVGISNGTAHIAINATFIVIILCVDRKYIRAGTFAALFVTGPMIDLVIRLLGGVLTPALPYPVRLVVTLASCVVLGFGLSGLINASVGVGGNDIIALIISDKLRIQFRWVRIAVDASFVIVGYLLGGVAGLGTIASVLLVGPIAQFFVRYTALPLFHLLRRFVAPAEGNL